ncbi:MAG: serine hydrolase domain-containing protein [Anaerolineales bacterium]
MTSFPLNTIEDPRFAALCERILADKKRLKVPGVAVGVWYNGQAFTAGFGRTSVENPLRVTPDTLFQVGSISKTFTATALMRLAEQGKLDLDTPVRKILPKFKMADPEVEKRLTTRHLLTHTGGWIGDYFDDFGNGDDALQKMVRKIRKLPQVTPLGAVWSYNNAGFNIASRVLEIITEKPYETAMQDLILTPLGLTHTFFYPSDLLITHRFVVGHYKEKGRVKVARPWAIGRAGNGVGGVVSSVRELLTYARFHMGDGTNASGEPVMRRETLEAMRVPQADAGGRGKIGLSWFIRQAGDLTIYGHGGATHGQQATFHFIPQRDFAVTLLTNSDDGGILTDSLLKWALEIYFDTALPTPQPIQKSDEELAEYTGHYDLPLSAFDLTARDGYLVLTDVPRGGFPTPNTPPGPPQPPVRLAFYDADKVIGLDEPNKGALGDFIRDAEGNVRFLRISGRVHPKTDASANRQTA